jgi:large subunit ribosomal protein L24
MPRNIVKDDTVVVIAGDEKGKRGKVLKIFAKKNRAIVEGINFIKRHTRATRRAAQGGIVEKEGPVHLSNLMVVCPKCGKPTRTGVQELSDGTRVRMCKQCGETMER